MSLSALLRKDPSFRPIVVDAPDDSPFTAEPTVRCPLCAWQPRPSSRWYCAACPFPEGLAAGCGTFFHTFEMGGRCPGCQHQWQWTCCLDCQGWSRHQDWYGDEQ